MLAGLTSLKELVCEMNHSMTGNISSLGMLKGTLQKVEIICCHFVEGNFMDLADFPHLKELDLRGTTVTGDIRDIGENDFSSIKILTLPRGVYGGSGYEFQRIADGHDLVRAVYFFKQQRPKLSFCKDLYEGYWYPTLSLKGWYASLSQDAPDWYAREQPPPPPPFYIRFVLAGSRIGYRWETDHHRMSRCEVNWLDPEPDIESDDYLRYIEELQVINSQVNFYKGFHQPPTEEEYNRLCERLEEEGKWW